MRPDFASKSKQITPDAVIQSFGASIFSEECKGDFARAAGQADALVAAARTPQEEPDAGILRAVVHLLQGEPSAASALLEQVLALVPDDGNRCLRALSYLLFATQQRYNAFPDGNGVGADEVSARWRGARERIRSRVEIRRAQH